MNELIVAESRYDPLLRTPYHVHQTAGFTLVYRGGYREEYAANQFECAAGGTLYRPAGEVHRDLIGTHGAHCLMVEMPDGWLQRMVDGASATAPWHVPNDVAIAARIRRELLFSDQFSAPAIEALVIELACENQRQLRTSGKAPWWLSQLRERIEAEFAQLPPLEVLARDLGIHVGHMTRSFRRQFGCTVGEYARRQKIAFCCHHLRHHKAGLSEISAHAGFSSQAHMTRVFKLHTAMTPAEFRRMHGGRAKRAKQ